MSDIENNVENKTDNWNKPFIRSIFSGPNGGGSTARISSFLVIIFALLWVTFLVVKNGNFPDFTGLTVFVSAIIGVIYYPGKINQIVSNTKNKPQ